MTDVAELNETLEASLEYGRRVTITASSAVSTCCGGKLELREGYEQTYVGRVVRIDVDTFTLLRSGLGRLSAVLVEHEHLLHAENVD